jgi:hypothetical protein
MLVVVSLGLLLQSGCAFDPWRQVRSEDSMVGYRRYVSAFPDSKHVAEAKEHIAYIELVRTPTLEGYRSFRRAYPDSRLQEELRPQLEPTAFEHARFAGTAAAYTDFLAAFPNGRFEPRARGNLAFLVAGGFTTGATELAKFAAKYPESDYAADAARSVASIDARDGGTFERVGLLVQIDSSASDVGRLAREFKSRATDRYESAGLELVDIAAVSAEDPAAALPGARLVIQHTESVAEGGGAAAETLVKFEASPGADPIWSRRFEASLTATDHVEHSSVVLNPAAASYWNEFFVPLVSWPTDSLVRRPVTFEQPVTALDSTGDRVVVLHPTGDFQLLELADSEKPLVLSTYQRPRDGARLQNVEIVGDRVALFGEDGLELVAFGPGRATSVARLQGNLVGSLSAVVPVNEGILLGGQRGLFLSDRDGAQPRRLLRRATAGMASIGNSVVFSDGESVFVSTVALLGEQRVLRQMKLGHEYAPGRVIAMGSKGVVLGKGGVLVLEIENPQKPRVLAQLRPADVGVVHDAVWAGGRIFLLGDRGVQLLDRNAEKVVQNLDVSARARVSRMGRFLVTAGDKSLQVVDAFPLTPASKSDLPAAPVSDR